MGSTYGGIYEKLMMQVQVQVQVQSRRPKKTRHKGGCEGGCRGRPLGNRMPTTQLWQGGVNGEQISTVCAERRCVVDVQLEIRTQQYGWAIQR